MMGIVEFSWNHSPYYYATGKLSLSNHGNSNGTIKVPL